MSTPEVRNTNGKRLSKLRVALAVTVVGALATVGVFGYNAWTDAEASPTQAPWFAGYVDVTATPTFEFESPTSEAGRDVMLSFIVADPNDGCEPTWGTAYSLDEASVALDLDRRIARLRQAGGEVAVSFGGLTNDELATSCTDVKDLAAAFSTVLDRYDIATIDLDIEGDDLADTAAGQRRATAIAELQSSRRASGDDLEVWLTLPAATFGMTEQGTDAVAQMLKAGVDIAGLNVMTMNFGSSMDDGESMADASIRTLKASHSQLSTLYSRADIELSDATVWGKLGATPMIGQNDNKGEIFTLQDAAELDKFAAEQKLGRMSMWSLNRDATCGPNYVDLERVSDSCSGIDQGDAKFADALAAGFTGRIAENVGKVTTSEPVDPAELVDDPATSPYPIWAEDSSYLKGTKIVWHQNVYQAKWWTKGELPDNPVLNEWETPWLLIGPVLPGETPIEQPTLPAGTYPDWTGTAVFEKGSRVLFDGVPFEAKWWTQGDSPEAASSDPDSSPWVPLTLDQIAQVIAPAQ